VKAAAPSQRSLLESCRALATQHGALLIADESVWLGRTGRYFAYQKFSSKPDIVLIAKPLAAGCPSARFLPTKPSPPASARLHGTTFGGGRSSAPPLSNSSPSSKTKSSSKMSAPARELRAGLTKLAAKFDFIREIRGEAHPRHRAFVDGNPFAAELCARLSDQLHSRFHPAPLAAFIITSAQVREFLRLFELVLAKIPNPFRLLPRNPLPPRPLRALRSEVKR